MQEITNFQQFDLQLLLFTAFFIANIPALMTKTQFKNCLTAAFNCSSYIECTMETNSTSRNSPFKELDQRSSYFIVQMKKLKTKDVKWFAQYAAAYDGKTGVGCRSPGSLAPGS